MNQFRDLTICGLVILAIALWVGQPENWTWTAMAGSYVGPYLVNAITFLAEGRPWTCLILIALALALFMTRLKY